MPTVIDNPILNSPFGEPTRHFRFDEEGITNDVVEARRSSSYFIPIAQPRKKGKELQFDTEWTKDRIEENRLVNLIRQRVGAWRVGGRVGVTNTTSRLLDYWTSPVRDKKLFFCQIEAVDTAVYIAEVAGKFGVAWMHNDLKAANDTSNPGLPRVALKMATGSGKTVVMAMLIAWQALNKLEDRHDARFSDAFLIVTPGLTIRDRLRVLLPTDPDNYYRQRDTPAVGSARAPRPGADRHHQLPRLPAARAGTGGAAHQGDSRKGRRARSWNRRTRWSAACAAIWAPPALPAHDLNLIIEVTGEGRKDKAAKVSTARTLWIPAVNNHGGFGRWAFVEVTDPWDAQRTIRAACGSVLELK